ncbi:MAG: DUF2971 domain-containing protein [Proteobacteria bacterium]|nr:MAG: DUF2971 domain-containing protein [Pseudomonadota bacterium]
MRITQSHLVTSARLEKQVSELQWVDEAALIQKHPTIFHYTAVEALRLILQSGGMWATVYGETNDRDEFRAFRQPIAEAAYRRLRPLVQRRIDKGELDFGGDASKADEVTRNEALVMFDSLLSTTPIPPYITCFCAHSEPHQATNGLLTMWRLYSKRDGRVALGFDTKALIEATARFQRDLAIYACYLDSVSYNPDDPEARKRLSADAGYYRLFEQTFEAIMDVGLGKRQADDIPDIAPDLDQLMSFYVACAAAKHPDFADEHEIRLVLAVSDDVSEADQRNPVLRPKQGRIHLNYLDALSEVMVGPNKDQDKLADEVRAQLDCAGFINVRVTRSQTPYRDTGE